MHMKSMLCTATSSCSVIHLHRLCSLDEKGNNIAPSRSVDREELHLRELAPRESNLMRALLRVRALTLISVLLEH